MKAEVLLQGAYDIHVHCAPDVMPRSQDLLELGQAAAEAGLAGVGLKDHTTSTVAGAYALNRLQSDRPRFFSSLALNPPVGGLNPTAVKAALREGADIIYFPTYGAVHHIRTLGRWPELPLPEGDSPGITVFDSAGTLKPEVHAILELIAEHDAVLGTGHVAPAEVLAVLRAARQAGIRRRLVTHASELVPGMTVDEQREAVETGALIEHALLVVTGACPGEVTLDDVSAQIRAAGIENVIVSSDLGQADNPPPTEGFAQLLGELAKCGFTEDEIRTMIVENPRRLLVEGR